MSFMQEIWRAWTRNPHDPLVGGFEITPDDGADLPNRVRAINVTTSGIVRVTMLDGSIVPWHVTAGIAFPVRATKVWATGTTAAGIRGGY
ncbi:MAG: hypothetical protein AAFQ38_12880 [Pseudomonadota bacterium]